MASVVNSWIAATAADPVSVTISGQTSGNLLVAISGHRSWKGSGDTGQPSATGWTHRVTHGDASSTSTRRAVGILTRTATGSDSISVDWVGVSSEFSLIVLEVSFTGGAPDTWKTDGANGTENFTVSEPSESGASEVACIAGCVFRSTPAVTWTGLTEEEEKTNSSPPTGGITTGAAFGSEAWADSPHDATADTVSNYLGSGVLLLAYTTAQEHSVDAGAVTATSAVTAAGLTAKQTHNLDAGAITATSSVTAGDVDLDLQDLVPDADVAATGWDTNPTPGGDLYAQVDETTASDTDFIDADGA